MTTLTKKEQTGLITLFKDYTSYYNANSISKVIGMSHVGAQKMLKKFEERNLTVSKNIGKSIIHKPNLSEDYTEKLISFLLSDEANNFKRWKDEFKTLFNRDRIIIIYGSIIKNYKNAEDIDIMIIARKNEFDDVNKNIKEIQVIMSKRIHSIKLTYEDFLKNVKNKNKAIVDIVKNGVVLYGQEKYVKIIKNVTSL